MWDLAQGAVDDNSPYSYLLIGEYFGDTCVIAEREGDVLGFVTGFRRPDEPRTQFVWQIVVGEAGRGEGLGSKMLEALVDGPGPGTPADCLEATVTPDNAASQALFRSFARRRSAECVETVLFRREQFPVDAGEHEPEVLFRIGPWPDRSD